MRLKATDAAPDLLHVRALGRWGDPNSGFTTPLLTGETCFASEADARSAWPRARRTVWMTCHRFRVPAAATHFDGLTMDSSAAVCDGWYADAFPLENILVALQRDRDRLIAFIRDDVAGAGSISDFLEMLREDLDTVERTARTLSAVSGDRLHRPYPHAVTSAERYGDVAKSAA